MKQTLHIVVLLGLLATVVFACKTTKKNDSAAPTVTSATWNNWTGGQAGVGGTYYEITFGLPKDSAFEVTGITIDDQDMVIDRIKKEEKVVVVTINENRSTVGEIPGQRPNFRTENPAQATATVVWGGKQLVIPIENFSKSETQNYQ